MPTASFPTGIDFLEVSDLTRDQLEEVVDLAIRVKAAPDILAGALGGAQVALIFEKPSTRTRVSLEVGIAQMGGTALVLRSDELQLGRGETLSDTGKVLDRYVSMVCARVNSHESLVELAGAMSRPVVNALSDRAHPLQALADVMTLRERSVTSVAYVGDGNNVAHSLLLGCALAGIEIRVAAPPEFAPDSAVVEVASAVATAPLIVAEDPKEAVSGAEAVYTDVWVSMGDEREVDARREALAPYRLDQGLLDLAAPDAIVLHCLPAHRDEEITAEVLDGPASVVFDQAENRLHSQKALLALLYGWSG